MVLRNEKDSVVKRVGVRVILYQELDLRMNMKTIFFYQVGQCCQKKLTIWPICQFGKKKIFHLANVVKIFVGLANCGPNLLSIWPMWSKFIVSLANVVNIYFKFGQYGQHLLSFC